MADIDVTQTPQGHFAVEVRSGGVTTNHEVTVPADYAQTLGVSGGREQELVTESIRFLLEREPPSSILSRFSLTDIKRYFPEYEGEIANRMGS